MSATEKERREVLTNRIVQITDALSTEDLADCVEFMLIRLEKEPPQTTSAAIAACMGG